MMKIRKYVLYNIEDSILRSEWNEPDRPYSTSELQYLKKHLFDSIRLSRDYVQHPCGHSYYVKENGQKHKQLIEELEINPENPDRNVGNCSVCWKRNKTPRPNKELCCDFIDLYQDIFDKEPVCLYEFEISKIFYIWLYNELYERREQNRF